MCDQLPAASIFISLLSLGVALYVMYRDRTSFDVEGSYKESFANMVDGIYLKIVNTGRRPITLHKLIFLYKNGDSRDFKIQNSIGERRSTPFEKRDTNHPCLSESQFFEFVLDQTNFDFDLIELEKLQSIRISSSTGRTKIVSGLAKIVSEKSNHLRVKKT